MSEISILRRSRQQQVTIGTATSDSSTFAFGDMAGASIFIDAPSTAATRLRAYGSHDDATYRQLFGSDGAPAEITLFRLTGTAAETVGTATQQITVYTSVPGTYEMPAAAYPLRFIRLVADADLGLAGTVKITSKG